MPCAITGCSSPSTRSDERGDAPAGAKHVPADEHGGAGADRQLGGQRRVEVHVERGRQGAGGYPAAPCATEGTGGDEFWRALRARHPPLREATGRGRAVNALYRGERHEFRSGLDAALQCARLAWVSDAFLAQVLYRLKARLQARGVPVLPRARAPARHGLGQVAIGDPSWSSRASTWSTARS